MIVEDADIEPATALFDGFGLKAKVVHRRTSQVRRKPITTWDFVERLTAWTEFILQLKPHAEARPDGDSKNVLSLNYLETNGANLAPYPEAWR
jgi:hypothetical protein